MAVYLDTRVEDSSSASTKTHAAWHRDHPILAVSVFEKDTSRGAIRLFSDDGTALQGELPHKESLQVTFLSWHPTLPLLAMGWESGEVCVWNHLSKTLHEPQTQHKRAVSRLQWSDGGSRIISIDSVGTCIGWKVDAGRGSLGTVFYHELRDSLTDITFRHRYSKGNTEIGRLARAAVEGDEEALNLFSDWQKLKEDENAREVHTSDSHDFYVGSTTGVIYFVSENGSCGDVLQMDGGVARLVHYAAKDMLVAITDTLVLAQFAITEDGSLTEQSRFKLSGHGARVSVIWVGEGLIAVIAGESSVRLLHLETGETTVLLLPDAELNETVSCIVADMLGSSLAVGTSAGRVIVWKRLDKDWKPRPSIQLTNSVKELTWCESRRLLGTITTEDVFILFEQDACFNFKDGRLALQMAAKQVFVETVSNSSHLLLQTEIPVKGLFVSQNNLAVSNGKRLLFYEALPGSKVAKFMGGVNTISPLVALHETSAYLVEDGKLQAKSFQGILKQAIHLVEEEGNVVCIDICGSFLVLGMSKGYIRVWDLSRREAKLHAGLKTLATLLKTDGNELLVIKSVKCNCKGNKVSVLLVNARTDNESNQQAKGHPILYVWNLDDDSVFEYNFEIGKSGNEGNTKQGAACKSSEVCGRVPVSHYWDDTDQRLLVCEAQMQLGGRSKSAASSVSELRRAEVVVVPMFVTTEHGILVQDVFPLDSDRFRLMGVQVPHFYLLGKDVIDCLELKRSKSASSLVEKVPGSKHVFRLPMRDFVGLEDCDSSVRDAIMTFSFFLTLGDMDEAFKAIKAITNQAVWENMAKMCVQTKRLDVAKICLGKMGHARGAWALRQAEAEPEIEARATILALQLGMIQEAEDLLEACGRYDLLIKLFEDSNQWERAIQVAQTHDRIRLRATYHNYAQHLEASGDIDKAIQMYEKSETHLFEVPRMLFDEPQALEQYMRNSRNKDMLKWWAQYMESIGEMETALQFYEASEDYLSLLRVHCYFNNVEKACEIANETGDRAACFHLARYLENQDNIPEAVHFFSRAKAYSNAIRVCKENQMDEQLFNLALLANQKETLEAARYFEQRQGALEKAVTLYQKGGWSTKAAELALQSGDLGALQQAALELGPNADPNLVKMTAERLAAVGKQDQAVLLLSASGQNERALELCLQSNVIITEELAETLSQNLSKSDKAKSSRILEKIAECCMKQENYHLAAKKFTQSGNKVQAMKALLKSGDTSKIIFFAGVSRQAEIYVLAANYLQSLDWRQNPDIMKHIVTYYTKARAYDLLSGFYESCAQVEIEEYQNYEKALGALNEAQNCLMQSGENPPKKLARLRAQMENVRRYVATQRLYTDSPSEAIAQCQELIQINPEPAVRRGDIFAFMVQHYVNNKDFSAARACLEDMQATIPNVNISQFLDGEVLRAVYGSS
ncbi:unnamed protein product, partial [Ixodes pacificus]